MQVKSYNAGNVGEVEFDEKAFLDKQGAQKVLYRTLKDAVVMFQANQRQGNASTRGRSKVKGSNAKPYRQKHTGRARAGDKKSPIWRGGGTVFGPLPRDFSYHMPKKARRVAARTAILGKLADGEVVIADLGEFSAPSAKAARKILADLGQPRRALIVLAAEDENVWKSFRNFPGVAVRTADRVCAHDVVTGGLIVAEATAMEALSARLGHVARADRPIPEPKVKPPGQSKRALARRARKEGQAVLAGAPAPAGGTEEYPVFKEEAPRAEQGGDPEYPVFKEEPPSGEGEGGKDS